MDEGQSKAAAEFSYSDVSQATSSKLCKTVSVLQTYSAVEDQENVP